MAKGTEQRTKLLYMKEIFERKSDEAHPLTIDDIRKELAHLGMDIKKSDTLVQGIEDLCLYSPLSDPARHMQIEHPPRSTRYWLKDESRLFQPDEIQLLVDSVQASKFLTKAKTVELIHKLSMLCSEHEGQKYTRDAFSQQFRSVKSDSPIIHENLALIREAIQSDRQISFESGHHDLQKRLVARNRYVISPLTLIYNHEFYYLLGWWKRPGGQAGDIRIFRVDRMLGPKVLEGLRREGLDQLDPLAMQSLYTQNTFNMFHGTLREVTMIVHNSLIDSVIDQFGADIFIAPQDAEHFRISPQVMVSPQFYGWVFGMNDLIEIVAPQEVRDEMRQMLQSAAKHHG